MAGKLTKRQKKGINFRERKHSKIKDNPPDAVGNSEDELDVHSLEDPLLVDPAQSQQRHQVSEKAFLGKRKGDKEERRMVAERKRKREIGEDEEMSREPGGPKPKRRRKSDGGSLDVMEQPIEDDVEAGEVSSREDKNMKQRFILFLGNLKYTTTVETIQAHFSVCVPPPTVRLLTPKTSARSPTKPIVKSKGCAFLEFQHRGALQQGLKLHHSQLDGRQINVELTAGGGGKGSVRLKKLKERNRELEGQRKRREPKEEAHSLGTQRFSATSGEEQTHTHKRTWTIGDVEDEATHRGGQKHKRGARKRGSVIKDFRTGVNAIPVG